VGAEVHCLLIAAEDAEERIEAQAGEINPYLYATDGFEVVRIDFPNPEESGGDAQLVLVDLPLKIVEERAIACAFAISMTERLTAPLGEMSREVLFLLAADRREKSRRWRVS
jgi:hypothetical protein